ncbi:hypothetical protein SVIO_079520 [Streptomyces violaceusniger]|uniref:DUF692 domain-containing protein n=1 Tax=Streptomyces violaceusniger TaxID=68280 RepID=A0A4D4LHE4_STRVO|nr:hypothetical protein SVIO_079520 [Streptomyces violaceusniger]
MVRLGTGIGWRPEIADDIARLPGIDWVEVVAENICPDHVPDALRRLRERGTTVVPHGVSLGLGEPSGPTPAASGRWPSGPRRWARRWSASTSRSSGPGGR